MWRDRGTRFCPGVLHGAAVGRCCIGSDFRSVCQPLRWRDEERVDHRYSTFLERAGVQEQGRPTRRRGVGSRSVCRVQVLRRNKEWVDVRVGFMSVVFRRFLERRASYKG